MFIDLTSRKPTPKHFMMLFIIFLDAPPGFAQQPHLETITFEESDKLFRNPERGFYRHLTLTGLGALPDLRKDGRTLVYLKILADAFREKEFSVEFLDAIQSGFDIARTSGIKVIPAVTYNNRSGDADASKEQIFRHIDQLKPLWKKNADVIYLLKAGFIGAWGEWHGSTHGLDTPKHRQDILFKILSALPKDRMVAIRSPLYKRQIFKGELLTLKRAFDGSNLARTGFHNDCFLSSDDDVGTYRHETSRAAGIAYIGGETRFTPFGGETCRMHKYGNGRNAIAEMEQLHCSWLNMGYHRGVLQRWVDQGCMDEIKRRMGYRFVLRQAKITQEVRPGGILRLNLTLENVGFSSPFNFRLVELALRNNRSGDVTIARLSVDPRYWFPGNSNEIERTLRIPVSLPKGTYSVFLRLPDPYPSLYDDPRYAIRFGNKKVWDEASGGNRIVDDLSVDPKIGGASDPKADVFKEVEIRK